MKFLSKFFLLLFTLLLTTPTVVSIIDKNADISFFFKMAEEEENHGAFNEIKSVPTIFSIPMIIDFEGLQKNQFSVFNDRKVNSIKPTIFLEPPELV
jgi:hypothetical protein